MNRIIVVAGPTASGKTAFAVRLAKLCRGEIVSADSMQIYREMNIASAKPTREEMEGIPHHLLDFLSPFESFSVADYVKLAKERIFDILARNRVPIVAGGTGLYISSLVDNVEFTEQEPDPTVRRRLKEEAAQKGGRELLYARLQKIDPAAAENIHPNNEKRVMRALEIYETIGKTLTQQNAESRKTPSPFEPVMLALCPPRELLYQRIDKRVDMMAEAGLFAEAERLQELGLTKDMQSMQGIGYKEVFDYLSGQITREACLEEIKRATRHYAKRQLTWFRRDKRYTWVDSCNEDAVRQTLKQMAEAFPWKNS